MNDPTQQRDELARLLARGRSAGLFGKYGRWLAVTALIILATLGYWLLRSDNNAQAPRYQTEEVTSGNLVVTVSATGNLQPTNQVDVGSELSGTIEVVFVDDNDRIKKGQVLARLDTAKLQDQIVRSKAALAAAEAQVQQMQATVVEARANLARLQHVAELSGGKVPSKTELDTAEAALKRAIANETSARAGIGQARATLKSDETNLSKAIIRSPIDGVVLARKVEPGQTVAASLQAPVLFTLAENLAQMELQVDVDEADVGQVHEGQDASFNVDAYPNRKYPAAITRVGYGSQTKEGVVSYLTVLAVNNDDLSLRPGMTATAEIITVRREDVLLVPNAALRFTPAAPAEADSKNGGLVASLMPRFPRTPSRKSANGASGKGGAQQVWILRDGQPIAIPVQVGASDGRMTEVTGGELQAGMQVITESLSTQK